MVFAGFTPEDFAIYQPECRTSAMYTLKRRAVKDKLKALAGELTAQLGGELEGTEVCFSDEAPGLSNSRNVDRQWLVFQRDAAARTRLKGLLDEIKLTAPDALDVTPHHKHAHLALIVDERGLEIGLRVHRSAHVDRQNLSARLKEGWARDTLLDLLGRCGTDGRYGAVDGRALPDTPLEGLNADALADWIESAAAREWLVVSSCLSPEQTDDETLVATCIERLTPLITVYRFVAWAPDNDHIAAKKAIKEAKVAEARGAHKKGDTVRILAGMWGGHRGVVEDVDKKGKLKVRVGLVSVRVESAEVAAG